MNGLKIFAEDEGFLWNDYELGEFYSLPHGRLYVKEELKSKELIETALGLRQGSFEKSGIGQITINDLQKGIKLNTLPDISKRRFIALGNYRPGIKVYILYKGELRGGIYFENDKFHENYAPHKIVGEIIDGKIVLSDENRINLEFGPGAFDLINNNDISLQKLIEGFDLNQLS